MIAQHFPFLDHDGILAFAHRGGAEEWPENTMLAFQGAVALGYGYLETDAYATRDGVMLAFHDDRLDRVTDQIGRIESLDYSQIKTARVAGQEPIPLLEEVLGTWPDIKVNIDPKHNQSVVGLIEAIKRTNAMDRVCIGSFSGLRLQKIRDAFEGRICTSMGPWDVVRLRGASFGLPVGSFNAVCVQVPFVMKGASIIDQRFILEANRRGLPVHVWTVNNCAEMHRLLDLGVAGIMTDRPSLLKQVLVERGQWA